MICDCGRLLFYSRKPGADIGTAKEGEGSSRVAKRGVSTCFAKRPTNQPRLVVRSELRSERTDRGVGGRILVSSLGSAFVPKLIARFRSWRDRFATLNHGSAAIFHFSSTWPNFDQFPRVWCFLARFVSLHKIPPTNGTLTRKSDRGNGSRVIAIPHPVKEVEGPAIHSMGNVPAVPRITKHQYLAAIWSGG